MCHWHARAQLNTETADERILIRVLDNSITKGEAVAYSDGVALQRARAERALYSVVDTDSKQIMTTVAVEQPRSTGELRELIAQLD
jgi:hypothetical protein